MTDPKQIEDLAAPIKDAIYAARRVPGRTMHQAADDAARAILADGWVHHDTLPYVACECGRRIYLPALAPDTLAAQRAIARGVLSELVNQMKAGRLEYGAGNASHAVLAWMEENYPEEPDEPRDQGDDWTGGFAPSH